MKKIRLFANMDRVTRTRVVYILLTAGTVAAALLFVLLNQWIFRLSEKRLYNRTQYEAISIISANSIGAPLSTETRVELFRRCEREGEARAVMPGELNAVAVRERMEVLWSDTLNLHASGDKLPSGESVSTVLRKTHYEATLRDFYDDETGVKLALWCAQSYCTAADGSVYCLSAQLDSRTGEVFSETCALFSNIPDTDVNTVMIPFLEANGYSQTLLKNLTLTETTYGYLGTLTLPDGLTVSLCFETGVQYEIRFV